MSDKRLSVIIPGYNNPAEWWRRCLESVMRNIGPNDEVICVDDGSVCRPDLLLEYAKIDVRVQAIFRERNGGLSSARNCALEIAQGRYVTFVDSDDEIMPETYERALTALISNDADISLFGVRSIWVNERLAKEDSPEEGTVNIMDSRTLKNLWDKSLLNYAWNKVYRTSFLRKHKLMFDPEGVPCEDIIFVLSCIMAKAKWTFVDHIGINYYRTHSSLLSRYKSSYVKGIWTASEVWKRYKEYDPGARDEIGSLGEVTRTELMQGEWDNIWRLGSPYHLGERWKFLKAHSEIAQNNLHLFFVKKMIYHFFRRFFYVRPLQRWHIKKIYPRVTTI